MTSSRPGSGAPRSVSRRARAAASVTAPRIPDQTTVRGAQLDPALDLDRPAVERAVDVRRRVDPENRVPTTAAIVAKAYPARVPADRGDRVEDARQLQADQHEQDRAPVGTRRPDRVALHPHLRGGYPRREPTQVDPGRDRSEHARDPELLGRQIGGVAREGEIVISTGTSSSRRRTSAIAAPTTSPIAIPPATAATKSTVASNSEKLPPIAAATATR